MLIKIIPTTFFDMNTLSLSVEKNHALYGACTVQNAKFA